MNCFIRNLIRIVLPVSICFLLVLLLFSKITVLNAQESRVDYPNIKCPIEVGECSTLEGIVEAEKITKYSIGDYLSGQEFDDFIKNDLTSLDDRNKYVARLFFQARVDYLKSDSNQLDKIYELFLDLFEDYSTTEDIGDLRFYELTDFYYDHQFWFDRYIILKRIAYWRWELNQEINLLQEIEKFQLLHKRVINVFKARGARRRDDTEDGSLDYSLDSYPIDYRLEWYVLVYAEALITDDKLHQRELINKYFEIVPDRTKLQKGDVGGVMRGIQGLSRYENDPDMQEDGAYAEFYVKFQVTMYDETKMLFRQAKLKSVIGEPIKVEIETMKKYLKLLDPRCDVELVRFVSNYIFELEKLNGQKNTI